MIQKKIIKYFFSNAINNSNNQLAREMRVKYVLNTYTELNLNHFRAALTAYYFARSRGGQLVLAIDNIKEKEHYEEYKDQQIGYLKQVMNWDEGYENQFNEEGKYGPYTTMSKMNRYHEVAEQLIKENKAYRCFCDKDKIQQVNALTYQNNKIPHYDGTCRNLSQEQIQSNLDKSLQYSIRLRTTEKRDPYKKVFFKDNIQKEYFIYQAFLQDMIIIKSNGEPTKFFMYGIDDIDMNISHVVRQLEWQKDTPKQQLLYSALNYTNPPQFFHLPQMFNSQGFYPNMKELNDHYRLSRLLYQGYSLQALSNFCITQIWLNKQIEEQINEKKDSKNREEKYRLELYSDQYLENNFTMSDVRQISFHYDQNKLDFFNRHYIRQVYLPLFEEETDPKLSEELISDFRKKLIITFGEEHKEKIDKTKDKYIVQIIEIVTNRIRTWKDLMSYGFFFYDPTFQTQGSLKSKEIVFSNSEINKRYIQVVKDIINIMNKKIPDSSFNDTTITKSILYYVDHVNSKMDRDNLFKFLRYTFTGYHQSHSIGLTCQIIGKNAALRRLRTMAKILEDRNDTTN